jgi:hypothetical protein
MADAQKDDARRAEREKIAERLLRDVPVRAEPTEPKSRWVKADKTKPDPRSVY